MSGLRRAVVAGGRGAVGSMFVDLLRGKRITTTVVDPEPGGDGIKGDITAPDDTVAEAVRAADVVLLAVPEPVALRALDPLATLLRPGAVLVDTLSVKSRLAAWLADYQAPVELLGLNPMFAPDLGMAGRPVAAVSTRPGPATTAVLDLVEAGGGRVVPITAEEHDSTTAATQALTHAAVLSFGLALSRLGVSGDRLTTAAPPPHLALLALLARIVGGSPEVYWDIQAANPHAAEARAALACGLRAFADAVAAGESGVAAAFAEVRALLGHRFDDHRERARAVLGSTKTPTMNHPQEDDR